MSKLSVILPSRDEKFLIPTIHDIFRNARGEVEVVAVLDSDKWPENWGAFSDLYKDLHTIHHGTPLGMRRAINSGVASAISRGAKFIAKFDAHCSFSEGFDEVLKAECEKDWIVVPRRGRLDPENWRETELTKPPIDYHYLSFPNDPTDFGGAGLNGKVWAERAIERAKYELDEEMSSQGSGWFMHADYFTQLELMDEQHYGPFWNEFQELGLKCWLSGGRVMVNKKAKYLHLHKGKKYGRGYKLQESALTQGRDYTMKWPWNEAWDKQTLPFSWLIEHFWPVPSWPENWEEILYASRKPKMVGVPTIDMGDIRSDGDIQRSSSLKIHKAHYGVGGSNDYIDVTARLQELVKDNSLDIIVNNSTLTPGQNPFRGRKKQLAVEYCLDEHMPVVRVVSEKDWLIIGPTRLERGTVENGLLVSESIEFIAKHDGREDDVRPAVNLNQLIQAGKEHGAFEYAPMTAPALNDYLVRKFQISDRRLRGPMPIELRDFHRNDLAQLFAELGFKRGAEIGVAEGHYSEILLKANPDLELLLVDPWQRYNGNPYAHSQEHQDFSLNETKRKTAPYPNVRIMQDFSMNAVREIPENSLDMVYIDAHHGFDWVMQDLIEWGKRVRSGGIISGDDYYHFKRHWAGVIEAVNAYTQAHQVSPWFLIDAPRSVDFFWVKV